MKQIMFIALVLVTIFTASCEKEEANLTNELVGTTWKSYYDEDDEGEFIEIKFKTSIIVEVMEESDEDDKMSGTYTLSDNLVTMIFISKDDKGQEDKVTIKGVIDGKKMTVRPLAENEEGLSEGDVLVFHKQ